MNKLNKESFFSEHKYMIGFVTDDTDCLSEICKNATYIILKTIDIVNKSRIKIKPVWINSNDNTRFLRSLRIVENDSIVYLALKRSVVFNGDQELDQFVSWIKKRILNPSEGHSSFDQYEKM
jgi:hypothetical protein